MWDSALVNLPIFAELYILFLKTNFGFVALPTIEEEKLLPRNFLIEMETKDYLLAKLEDFIYTKENTGRDS